MLLSSSTENSENFGYTVEEFLPSSEEEEPPCGAPVESDTPASPDPPHQSASAMHKDWNAEYQAALAMPLSAEKFQRIRDLARDFEYAAQTYSRIIVSEVCVPDSLKSIRPAALGGIGGGSKFIANGIMFKFAVDQQLQEGVWMYGGEHADDELAIKAGHLELKGLISWMACSDAELGFPLMSIIDYKGYRLIATSLLPIDASTLKYGSPDGGRTVLCEDQELGRLIERAARTMGLGSLTMANGRQIFGPTDIEGHKGRDGRFYLIDFARTFPAEYISRRSPLYHPRSIFFSMLRPEFVRVVDLALCSDVFSGFMNNCISEEEAKRLHKVAYKAARILHDEVIPSFALALIERFEAHSNATLGSIDAVEDVMDDLRFIAQEMHRRGINLRHLGRVRTLVPEKHVYLRLILLTEMACRTLKSELRRGHRRRMESLTFPSDAPFRQVALRLFNVIIEGTDQFWTTLAAMGIKRLLGAKYGSGLSDAELDAAFDLRANLSLRLLLLRIQETTYVRFSERATRDLTQDPHTFVFTDSDIETMQPRIKSLHLVSWSEANIAFMRAMSPQMRYSNESMRLLAAAQFHLEAALGKATTNVSIMNLLVRTLYQMALTSFMNQLELDSVQQQEEEEELTEEEPTPVRSRARSSTANLYQIPNLGVSFTYLRKAVTVLDRLLLLSSSLPKDESDSRDFLARVYRLAGMIMAECGVQLHHFNRRDKGASHYAWFQKAIARFVNAYSSARHLFFDALVREARQELDVVNQTSTHLAVHNLNLLRLQCTAMVEVGNQEDDAEMLLLLGEIEVALSKRVHAKKEQRGLRDAAHAHFHEVLTVDPDKIAAFFKLRRNVLLSLVKWKPDSALGLFLQQQQKGAARLQSSASGWPQDPGDYLLVRPIRDKEGYADSSGILWEATCIPTEETVAIKIVENNMWKRAGGKMPDHIIRRRQRIATPRVVHYHTVFNDAQGSTWFVMPRYHSSAYAFLKMYADVPSRVLLSIIKLCIVALQELHAEGLPHTKVTFRNMLLVEPDADGDHWTVKMTNKAPQHINTLIFRNITNPHATFSASKLRRALVDYDLSPGEAVLFASAESAEDDSDISSSSDTIGSNTGVVGLSEFVRREEEQQRKPEFTRIAKSEDIVAVLKILSKVFELVQKSGASAKELAQWDAVVLMIQARERGSLPTLEELMQAPLFSQLDAERELSVFMNKKQAVALKSSAASSTTPLLNRRVNNEAPPPPTTDEDAFAGDSPVELLFAAGSKREKLYIKVEEAARRLRGASTRRSGGKSWGRNTSPRSRTKSLSLSHMVYNVINAAPRPHTKAKGRSLTNIFSSSPPTLSRVMVPLPHEKEEFNADWVYVFCCFFYNKFFLMWQSLTPSCTCDAFEAGKGSWLWKNRDGKVVQLSATKYVGCLLASFYQVMYKHNILNQKIAMDMTAAEAVYTELRDVMRRMLRVFFHISYHHWAAVDPASPPDNREESSSPLHTADGEAVESPPPSPNDSVSPKSPRKSKGGFSSRRLSRERSKNRMSAEERAVLSPPVLWEVFSSFCTLFKVNMEEKRLMQSPLF